MGGSADLTGSNLTNWKECVALRSGKPGNHINYGVREFGMSAIMNGVALHGGFIPFGATFLTFSDYSRNALRMAALMKLRSIFVFTHDSIGLGEDGPTHQSVEHVSSLRLIPNLDNWRPCDTVESAAAWGRRRAPQGRSVDPDLLAPEPAVHGALKRPDRRHRAWRLRAARCAERQSHPHRHRFGNRTGGQIGSRAQGAGHCRARVVSMPSTDVFDRQDAAYKASVLTRGVPRVAIEA
ncbi:hypothetical protein LP419_10010 [Massilia sp. H-1]|nr:hypothetical protein LP419_10010 [Massilia sp. H-1]